MLKFKARAFGAVAALIVLGSGHALPAGKTKAPAPAAEAPMVIPAALTGKLGYVFEAAAKDETSQANARAAEPTPTVASGTVYDTDDILAMMTGGGADTAQDSLFGPAALYLNLFDAGRNVASSPWLAACQELDIYADRVNPGEQRADCDGHVYSLAIAREGIALLVDQRVARLYALAPGAYAINGVPFRVE